MMGTLLFLTCSLLAVLGTQVLCLSKEGAPNDTPILHLRQPKDGLGRVKRAWVIPPISVSENHKRLPHLLVQIKSDKQQPGGVIYSVKGPGVDEEPRGIFSIEKLSGKVYLNTMLDREKNGRFRLKAYALSLGGEPLEDPTDLEIVVMDQNDNRPVFKQKVFTGRVVEGAATGTFVLKAEATDADDPETDNAALKYSILEPGLGDLFSMDELSGEIRTAHVTLDREVVGLYNLTLQVADMSGEGLATTAMAVIYVEDINDNPPEFTQKEFSMEAPENQLDVAVGRVMVQDKDLPGSSNWLAKFTILEGDPTGAFTIQTDPLTNDGILSLVKALNYEHQNLLELLVSVQNQSPLELSASKTAQALATIRVHIQDGNEAPLFRESPCRGSVEEGAPAGTDIILCRANDPDTHQVQELRFSAAPDLASWLQVIPESGLVQTLQKVPPRSAFVDGWYTSYITAADNGTPPLTATATLSIEVREVNDHAPLLLPGSGELCSQGGGGLVLRAVDEDLPPHAEPFHFRLGDSLTQPAGNWTLSRANGTHVLLWPQGDVAEGLHVVPLLVSDSGSPPRIQEQLLNISVCACDAWGSCRTHVAAVVGAVAGLSFGALMIILCSAILLLLLVLLVATLEHSRRQALHKGLLGSSQEDLRDNVLNYNEQGGGEEDQDAYDLSQLRSPGLFLPPAPRGKLLRRRDAPYGYALTPLPRRMPACPSDIGDFIVEGLEAADSDPSVPPYDTALIYDYEGEGSAGGSLSSILSSLADDDQNYDYLNDWGPRFQRLAELYGQ